MRPVEDAVGGESAQTSSLSLLAGSCIGEICSGVVIAVLADCGEVDGEEGCRDVSMT